MADLDKALQSLGDLAGVDVEKARTGAAKKPAKVKAPKAAAKKPPGNKTAAPRGRRGSATPKAAPIHRTVPAGGGAPRHPNGTVDHAAARAQLQQRSAAFRSSVAANREKTLPKINHGGFNCSHCGHTSWRLHKVAGPGGVGHSPTVAMRGCVSCGTMHPTRIGKEAPGELDIFKSMDSSETAVQGGGVEVGHRTNCPRGGDAPCGSEQAGKCSTCGAGVQDHYAIGKSLELTTLDLVNLAAEMNP